MQVCVPHAPRAKALQTLTPNPCPRTHTAVCLVLRSHGTLTLTLPMRPVLTPAAQPPRSRHSHLPSFVWCRQLVAQSAAAWHCQTRATEVTDMEPPHPLTRLQRRHRPPSRRTTRRLSRTRDATRRFLRWRWRWRPCGARRPHSQWTSQPTAPLRPRSPPTWYADSNPNLGVAHAPTRSTLNGNGANLSLLGIRSTQRGGPVEAERSYSVRGERY